MKVKAERGNTGFSRTVAPPYPSYIIALSLTRMDTYPRLSDDSDLLSPYRDDETKPLYSEKTATPSTTERPSLALRLVFALCLMLSISLVSANAWATHELSVSLQHALPVRDVMQLGRADQYDGLSDRSRHTCTLPSLSENMLLTSYSQTFTSLIIVYYHTDDQFPDDNI